MRALCAPVSHCTAGKANSCCRSCYVFSIAQLRESSCSCDSSSAAVKALVVQQAMCCSFTNQEITEQEILTDCLLSRLFAELLPRLLHCYTGAIALDVHEEPNCALNKDSSCTSVKMQDTTGTQYCTAWQKGKDAALHCVHVSVHTHVLVSPNTQHDAIPASCKQPQPISCLYVCLYVCEHVTK